MSRVRPIRVVIQGIDEFTGTMNKVLGKVNSSAKNLQDVGKTLSYSLTAPILGAGTAIVKYGHDYQHSMNIVQSVTQATSKEMTELSDVIRDVSKNVSLTPKDIMGSAGFLGRAGFNVKQIKDTIKDAVNLSIGTDTDASFTANVLTNIMQTFGALSTESQRYADVLAATTAFSNTNMQSLADSFTYSGSIAKDFGIEIEEISKIFGALGNSGIFGSIAGTATRTLFTRLMTSSEQMDAVFEHFNIKRLDESGNMRNIIDLIKEFQSAMDGMHGHQKATIIKALFGQVPVSSISALVRAFEPGGSFDVLDKRMNEGVHGFAEQQANVLMQGLPGTFALIRNALSEIALNFGFKGGVFEMVNTHLSRFLNILVKISELSPKNMKAIVQISAIGGIIGPILIAFSTLIIVITKTFMALSSAFALISKGVASITAFAKIATIVKSIFGLISGILIIFGAPVLAVKAIVVAIVAIVAILISRFIRAVTISEHWHNVFKKLAIIGGGLIKVLIGVTKWIFKLLLGGSEEDFKNSGTYKFFDWLGKIVDSTLGKIIELSAKLRDSRIFGRFFKTNLEESTELPVQKNGWMVDGTSSNYGFNALPDKKTNLSIEIKSDNGALLKTSNKDSDIDFVQTKYGSLIYDLGI